MLAFENVLQIYSVLQLMENEWETSSWIFRENVVTEHIFCERAKMIDSLVHVEFCFIDCVKSLDNGTSAWTNAKLQSSHQSLSNALNYSFDSYRIESLTRNKL